MEEGGGERTFASEGVACRSKLTESACGSNDSDALTVSCDLHDLCDVDSPFCWSFGATVDDVDRFATQKYSLFPNHIRAT